MSFYHEVGIPFGLSTTESVLLKDGLQALGKEFQQIESTTQEKELLAKKLYQRFESLAKACGIGDDELEVFVNHLFFTDEAHTVMTCVIPSYYTAGGDVQKFAQTYELILEKYEFKQ